MRVKLFMWFVISWLSVSLINAQPDTIYTYYKSMNDAEIRLIAFKDSENDLQLKIIQLDLINSNRKKFNAENVMLDILASRVANKMCREASENNFAGHWNMAGEKPYHRYAFAGGKDHITENASAKWIAGTFGSDKETTLKTMLELHSLFMAEKSPNDGHKKNCINKMHNYVGIGMYAKGHQFSYYEEFIDRYFKFGEIPQLVQPGESFSLTVSTQPEKYLLCLLAYYEKKPESMLVKSINRKTSYTDFSNKEALRIYPWELAKMRKDHTYTIELKFTKPGLYYIHLYQNNTEIKTEKTFDTDGKVEGSGIVIKVE
ncbi:MAG: hypothetical protein H7296_02215 [Bacteroidia bacterium]|nr:hypothetical protein [Bacteroidia bacterium]